MKIYIIVIIFLNFQENSNIEEAFWRIAKHLKDLYESEEGLRTTQKQEVILDSKSVGGRGCCG